MNKKLVATLIVGGVALGTLQLNPTLASEDSSEEVSKELHASISTENEKREGVISREDLIPRNAEMLEKYGISLEGKTPADILNELLLKKAKELGISTEGKSIERIKFELLKEEAKKAGISIEGKDEATLLKELKSHLSTKKPNEEQLRKIKERNALQNSNFQSFLKENGISIEGKNLADLQMEILVAKAKELGISTEGKSLKDLQQSIQSVLVIQKANELGISTEGKSEETLIKELKEAVQKNEEEAKNRR